MSGKKTSSVKSAVKSIRKLVSQDNFEEAFSELRSALRLSNAKENYELLVLASVVCAGLQPPKLENALKSAEKAIVRTGQSASD